MRSRLPFFSSPSDVVTLMARINQALRVCLHSLLLEAPRRAATRRWSVQYHGEVPFSDCGDSAHRSPDLVPDRPLCIGVYLVPWCSYLTPAWRPSSTSFPKAHSAVACRPVVGQPTA